jgi:NADPH-dependent glutamate synthase beta subunit-like oxidoreductase
LPGVLWGVDFLSRVAEGEEVRLKDRVIVIGGGNVAIDAALTAMRCGTREVTVVCLEKREDMPAHEWQVEGALSEGVELITSWGPSEIVADNGQIKGVDLIHCVSAFDDQGFFNPKFDHTKTRVDADQVIMAVGQEPDLSFLGYRSDIEVKAGLIAANAATLETGMKDVYAGGDVVDQPRSVVHAVGSGKNAAIAIDRYLKQHPGTDFMRGLRIGQTGGISFRRYLGESSCRESQEVVRFEHLNPSYFQHAARQEKPKVAKEERQGFEELYGNLTPEKALGEAGRCLSCGLCDRCGNCVVFCPDIAVSFKEGEYPEANDDYCKGCGICAVECPGGFISMTQEGE